MADPQIDSGALPQDAPPIDSFRPTETVRLEDALPLDPVESPQPEDDKPLPGSQTPHARGMEAILIRRREQIEQERLAGERAAGVVPEPTAPAPEAPPLQTAIEPTPPPPTPQPQYTPPPEPQYTPPPQPRVHRIVVRGTPIDLSEQDMVRAAQHAVEMAAQQRDAEILRQQQPPEPQFDRPRLVETVKALQYGDEDAATEALAQFSTEIARAVRPQYQQSQQQIIDPNQIADAVYQRVSNVQSLTDSLTRFQNDYADIVSDEKATRLAALEAETLKAQYEAAGIPRTVEQIMYEAADSVRSTISRWRGENPASTPGSITPAQPARSAPALAANGGNRVAVKRSTPQAPAASSAPQPADTPNVRSGVTGSQVVEWMRRTRNQPVYR